MNATKLFTFGYLSPKHFILTALNSFYLMPNHSENKLVLVESKSEPFQLHR